MPYTSIGMTALLHMPWVPTRYSAHDIYPAIVWPFAKNLLLSIAFHIGQVAAPPPIYSSALGPESNEHAELEHNE
jgi:hypothetical protein